MGTTRGRHVLHTAEMLKETVEEPEFTLPGIRLFEQLCACGTREKNVIKLMK